MERLPLPVLNHFSLGLLLFTIAREERKTNQRKM